MSIQLPLPGNPVRELIDMEFLATLGSVEEQQKLPTMRQAQRIADEMYKNSPTKLRAVHLYVLSSAGVLRLYYFGPRGGVRGVWTFGKL